MKLFDVDGNEVEAVSQAEVTEQVTKAKEEALTSFKESEEYKASQKELADAKEALEKASKKDENFAALRKAKEEAEKKASDLEEKFSKELSGVKDLVLKKDFDNTLNLLADGDAELEKKIRLNYDKIVKADDTEELRKEKLIDAYKLTVSNIKSPDLLNGIISGRGGANPKALGGNKNAGFSPELVELGKKLGLTDKDIEKHGNK